SNINMHQHHRYTDACATTALNTAAHRTIRKADHSTVRASGVGGGLCGTVGCHGWQPRAYRDVLAACPTEAAPNPATHQPNLIRFPCTNDNAYKLRRQTSGRICGNRITSRIEGESVKSITRRSIPMPSPAVGGMPYSSARTKSA